MKFTELENNFSEIEDKILKISVKYKDLKQKYAELLEKNNHLKAKYEEEVMKNEELIEEQKKMKLTSAISGNPDHNRLMKSHINRLIKEIDVCIAELRNSGL